jgi:hypothetical protein
VATVGPRSMRWRNPLSRCDDPPLYANWLYKPMRLTRSDLHGHITSTTVFYVS